MAEHEEPTSEVAAQADPQPEESPEARHLRLIRDQVEEAKDPSTYETYDCIVSPVDPGVELYAARRRGIGHIRSKRPCQDFCLVTEESGCTILADADGVSSCARSDVGSRLACDAVAHAVRAASASNPDEDQLVRRLLSTEFRDRLVSLWIRGVMEEVAKEGDLTPRERLRAFSSYGTTLMYAILTEHWIVVGNVGDGQVLVFNDDFGVKLRVHAPKESSRVRCLANERCVREDFIVAKYPRDTFDGVLLTTDGIYESLDKGRHLYWYAQQMKDRFQAREPHEPYQAFCYLERGEPYKDFSRMRTQDDCSIALALDGREGTSDFGPVLASVLDHADAAMVTRWAMGCVEVYVKRDGAFGDVVVTHGDDGVAPPEELESAVLEVPEETWEKDGLRFDRYVGRHVPTLEFLQHSGRLRRHSADPTESEQWALALFRKLKSLRGELLERDLALNPSALFNVSYDGDRLHVRREALSGRDAESDDFDDFDVLGCLFGHLLGVLESDGRSVPVFDIGYVDRGIKIARLVDEEEPLLQVVRVEGKLYVRNVGSHPWRLADDATLQPGEILELAPQLDFALLDDRGEELETYHYASRELA